MKSYLSHLECTKCEAQYAFDKPIRRVSGLAEGVDEGA